jgi:uncharacterized damage-inducible protein DinB
MTDTLARDAADAGTLSPKSQFVQAFRDEHARTMKLLRAYPPSQGEMRPHPTSRSARELAFVFAMESGIIGAVLTGGLQFPLQFPSVPETWDAVLMAVEQAHATALAAVRSAPDERLTETSTFPIGPKQLGDVPTMQIFWMMLMDHVHHRGQLSVYLRMTGSKVPSIYGASRDEPWF